MRYLFACLLCCFVAGLAPLNAQTLPPNLFADTAHAPFLHGVASFDPTPDHVIVWTKVDPGPSSAPITLTWELYADAGLTQLVSTGTAIADQPTDWTATHDLSLPQPGTFYWYRWRDSQGNRSVVGRTKSAPMGSVSQVRLAVMSCSSIYSGYFNAYRRIGERDDIDLVIHLGDYIYDFVDADEQVRVPTPAPIDPQALNEWRDRHAYYLLDPDLRLARQMHPWAVIWDNHDTDGDSPQHEADAKQAFLEYVPMRLQNPARPDLIYRRLAYGDLLDILLVDATTLRNRDTVPGGEFSIIGDTQWTWLAQELTSSTARWRVLGQERMLSRFSTAGLGSLISFGDGPVADSGAWDGYNADRLRLLNHLDQNGIDNNVILSGDIHTSFANDVPIDYGSYDAGSGTGSVAVEFLPTSITRGNFDEAGVTGFLATLVGAAISAANPHMVYSQLTSHGYGILDVRQDTVTAEFWYSPILQTSPSETFAAGYQCVTGQNHWQRSAISNPTVAISDAEALAAFPLKIALYPNPAGATCTVQLVGQQHAAVKLTLIDLVTGAELEAQSLQMSPNQPMEAHWDLEKYAAGNYGLQVRSADESVTLHLLHVR